MPNSRIATLSAGVLSTALLTVTPARTVSADPYTPAQWDFINTFAQYFPPTATPPEVLSLATATCQMIRRGELAVDMARDLKATLGPISNHDAANIIVQSEAAQCPDKIGYIG